MRVFNSGAKRASSAFQFPMREAGTMRRAGSPSAVGAFARTREAREELGAFFRALASAPTAQQKGDDLEGFAEAHVIG